MSGLTETPPAVGTVVSPADPAGPPAADRPPGAPAGAARGAPRLPLRVTLVALLVALVAVGLGATGVAATSLLRDYLVSRQDADLTSALRVAQRNGALIDACLRQEYRRFPGSAYYACIPPTGEPFVLQGPVGDSGLPALDARQAAAAVASGHPMTVPSVDGTRDWRVIAGPLPAGYGVAIGTDLGRDREAMRHLIVVETVVGLIVLSVLGAAGYLLVRNSLRPLREVEQTARAIAAGDLSQRVPAGDDRTEVGRLSIALNVMLARIESSFRAQRASEEQARASEARMRRFVADASHELRTPLTSIRGFAELYRQGAVSTPEDVRSLMHRIETESSRMGLLVEDLLHLARLDQQRPLSLTPVDLAGIAGDAVHDARMLQPERPIGLHLDESLTDAPVVLGDEARLRQVVGNLVTNALTHTPVTARVTVRVAQDPRDAAFVVLQVADEGPGMAPQDAERVFERFYRADGARTREAGGTGLGLAIVAGQVAAHGGTVHLETAPGQGAVFTVRLPRSGPPRPAPPDRPPGPPPPPPAA